MFPARRFRQSSPGSAALRRDAGFTLFEVLIAFLVLSIGLMGVAGLQSLSKASQFEAIQRSRAVALAEMAAEMIRSNPQGASGYVAGPLGGGTITSEPTPDCSVGTACSPAELAAHDLWEWEQAIDGEGVTAGGAAAGGLVQPAGCIRWVANSAPGATPVPPATATDTGQYLVLVQWRGLESTTDAVTQAGDLCSGAAVGADPFRRLVALRTYIVNEDEL
jgi:type IV pilus assembly protein PilV